jgi:alpha 1,3-glucosidase
VCEHLLIVCVCIGNVVLKMDHGSHDKNAFSITVQVSGQDTMIINSNNLLQVESIFVREEYEQKKQQEQQQTPVEEQQQQHQAENEENAENAEAAEAAEQQQTDKYEGENAVGLDIRFVDTKHVYGLPERASNLALKSTDNTEPYRLFNLDIFEYELDNPIGLYGIIPLLYSIQQKSRLTTGIFVLNPSETFVDINHDNSAVAVDSHWISETGLIDVFILSGPSPKKLLQQLLYLTGYAPIPQQFATAYHQCRWNYKDEADVATVDAKFDEYNIPYDVLWLDIEHTDQKKYFTWDKHLFPNPKQMQESLASRGRKMVTISDPHIKRTSGYHVHDEATKNGYYVKKSDGVSDYEGHCWPGSSSWLDYLNPTVRKFYAGLFAFDKYEGSSESLYTWIDMNEPSVFSGPEITMDKDAIHYGGLQHGQVHNMYGLYQAMATYDGHLQRRSNTDRPFILTRSFFAGSQRYVAVWTGDNAAKWDHLEYAQPMLLALGISGLSFVGADVGGFFGNPDTKLLVRWYQAGAFYPFFRAHAHIETQRREPWLFGEDNMNLIRAAIQRRYTLLPYYYTLHMLTAVTGSPVMRPLFYEYYDQEIETLDVQNEFLIGSDLLVRPVVQDNVDSQSVYLPSSKYVWYDYDDFTSYKGGQQVTIKTPQSKIPVFQRGGSIIPTKQRMRRSSHQMTNDPYTLRIALDDKLYATGDLYVDDGRSFEYQNGNYVYLRLEFNKNTFTSTRLTDIASIVADKHSKVPLQSSKAYHITNTIERIIIAGYPSKPNKIILTIDPVSNDPTQVESIVLQSELEFEYDSSRKLLTIRKPLVQIDSKFTIQFE